MGKSFEEGLVESSRLLFSEADPALAVGGSFSSQGFAFRWKEYALYQGITEVRKQHDFDNDKALSSYYLWPETRPLTWSQPLHVPAFFHFL